MCIESKHGVQVQSGKYQDEDVCNEIYRIILGVWERTSSILDLTFSVTVHVSASDYPTRWSSEISNFGLSLSQDFSDLIDVHLALQIERFSAGNSKIINHHKSM